ncbi:NlpC/P60 family protein [Rhodococcus zopfii]|uniref:NlpC/P60 family protein n=2 Tax=Rhodococcus zopfii TaxID=43772 RepID=UPI000932AE14
MSTGPRLVVGLGLVATLLVGTAASVGAVPEPPTNPSDDALAAAGAAVETGIGRVGELIVRIASADQQLAELENQVAIKRENVNRALVDLQNARDAADAAAYAVTQSQQALRDAGVRIEQAQSDFDAFARSSYTRGTNAASLASFLGSTGPDDLLDRAQVMRLLSSGRNAVLDALERARTEEANKNSSARAAKQEADAASEAAEQRKADAESAIAQARSALDQQAADKQRIEIERAAAQTELDAARQNVAGLENQRADYAAWDRQRQAEEAARAAAEAAAQQAAAEAAQRVAADAAARARAAELANGQRPHTQIDGYRVDPGDWAGAETPLPEVTDEDDSSTGDTSTGDTGGTADDTGGRSSSGRDWGNPDPGDPTGESSGTQSTPKSKPRSTPRTTVIGPAAVETVIDRAMSQIGVPYAWGGGDENGPTRGIRDGGVADSYGDYNKVGFDCSGLMIYAFAGIGISLPHYTGYQYTAGTQVPSAEMKRGDMIFYGPNASQHVGLYLGDGQMLEAPQSGSHVKISPVRWAGMTPYVVRMVS